MDIALLHAQTSERFCGLLRTCQVDRNELTLEVAPADIHEVCYTLKQESAFECNQCMDITAVDYLTYGLPEWETQACSNTGFSRGCMRPGINPAMSTDQPRFAVVYHLLSLYRNHRIRVKCFLEAEALQLQSVVDLWPSANWFEREVYDLFGIVFTGHPDLRRLLTDYGFIGHPFRRDFPLSGHVEMRYDAKAGRVIYEPVSIEPRVTVPKVIRDDNRYHDNMKKTEGDLHG